MTPDVAYKVIGVQKGSSISLIEQAYKCKLQKLHRQMIPGQPLPVRQKAERQVIELKNAWEVLKNIPQQGFKSPQPKKKHLQPQKPAASFTQKQPTVQPLPVFGRISSRPNLHVAASFAVAAVMMILVVALCYGSLGKSNEAQTAYLRVLAVPWCSVEIDGRKLGSSGQPEPFKVREGSHKLKLSRNNKILTKEIELIRSMQTIVKAQFDKGMINVGE